MKKITKRSTAQECSWDIGQFWATPRDWMELLDLNREKYYEALKERDRIVEILSSFSPQKREKIAQILIEWAKTPGEFWCEDMVPGPATEATKCLLFQFRLRDELPEDMII